MRQLSLATPLLRLAAVGAVLLLGACGKQQAAPPAAPGAASSTATSASAATPAPAPAASAPARASTAMPAAAPASAGTTGATGPAPASSVAPPFAFDKLTLGSAVNADHKITQAADRFASDDNTLYASVATSGSSKNATLNATWRYLEGGGQLVSSISQTIATDGPALTTFQVQNPDLWPEGKYKVEISIDGKPVASQDFQIGKR